MKKMNEFNMLNPEMKCLAGFTEEEQDAFKKLPNEDLQWLNLLGKWIDKNPRCKFHANGVYRLKLEFGKHYYMSTTLIDDLLIKVTFIGDDYIEYDVIENKHGDCYFSAIKTIRPATDKEIERFKEEEEDLEIIECEIDWEKKGKCRFNNKGWNVIEYPIGAIFDGYILIGFKFKDIVYIYDCPICRADGKIKDKATHAVFQKLQDGKDESRD